MSLPEIDPFDEFTGIPAGHIGDLSFKLKPGESMRLIAASVEDGFYKGHVSTVREVRGMSPEEFDFAITQGWMEGHGTCLSGDVFEKMAGPLVYAFSLDCMPIYVGLSRNGISRPCSPKHHASYARSIADEVRLYFCKTPAAAHALEAFLVSKWQPLYNKNGVYSSESVQ